MQSFRLQRRLLLSPQVFQQACRRNSSGGKIFDRFFPKWSQKPAGEEPGKSRTTPKPADVKDEDDDIRWFEKDMESGEVKRVAENPEDMEVADVRKQLQEATQRLKRYDANVDSKEYHDVVLEAFPEGQRKEVARVLAAERERRQQLHRDLAIHGYDQSGEPVLKSFQSLLCRTADTTEVDKKDGTALWRSYQQAKKAVPGLNARLSAQAWHLLWRTISKSNEIDEYWEDKVLEMSQGMAEANVILLPGETEAKYEAMILKGRGEEARLEWKRGYEATQGKSRINLELGIKLHAALGDMRAGHRIVRHYLTQIKEPNVRVVHPLIQASVQTGNDHMAYTLYMTLRDKLGDNMQMQDYDVVIAHFLTHDKKDLALAIFRDMMLQGSKKIKKKAITVKAEKELQESTMRRLDIIQHHSINSQEVNAVSLQALAALPKQWQNKFFFASWIKKLIGMSDIPGAIKVVELMYERGIMPDATHVNGIVGGLLRAKDREDENRGQELAWAMIYRRIAHTTSLTGHDLHLLQDFGHIPAEDTSPSQRVPLDLSRPVPLATAETFNILGLHYLLSQKWIYLRHLRRMLKPAGIKMPSFFMNHILYMQLYNNGPGALWNDFLHHTKTTLPDVETFNAVWHAQQDLSDPRKRVQNGDMPGPRVVFKTMMDWRATLNLQATEKAVEMFGKEIYARIITTLCNRKDFAGVVVAMNTAWSAFATAPDADTAGLIVTGLGNIYAGQIVPTIRSRGRGRRQLRANPRVDAVEKILEHLRAERKGRLQRDGISIEDMDETAQLEQNVALMVELVRIVLGTVVGSPALVNEAVQKAAVEMGVPEDMASNDLA